MLDDSINTARRILEAVWQQIRTRFVLRWTLANILGWSIGLYVGSGVASLFGGLSILSVMVAGTLAGSIAGGMQALALMNFHEDLPDNLTKRWIIYSTLGGVIGAMPAFIATIALIAGFGVGFAVMGAVFGLCFGWVQTIALCYELPDLPWLWVPANTVGGCLCGTLSLGFTPINVPIFCTLGPVLFGIITGFAWVSVVRMSLDE